jgi:hypothetical protein
MIIWLASYPRAGNMLLRMILRQVFGCNTYTKYYNPPPPTPATLAIREASGTAPLGGTWPEAYARMSKASESFLVKTHDAPEDSAKAVYVARNGFAAIISYQHFLRDFEHQNYSLEDIIRGRPQFGSWGYHLDVWQPFDRANTLLLTYEGMMRQPEEQIAKLAEFCGLRPQKDWSNEFDRFHDLHPTLFRKAEMGDASAAFSDAEKELFWSLHGDWMQRLGYATHILNSAKGMPEARRKLAMEKTTPQPKVSSVRRAIAGLFRQAR